jgi:cytochrome c553
MRVRTLAVAAAVLAATLTVASAAAAHERERERDEEHEERRPERAGVAARSADPTYVKECGSCHLAYPPGLLPAASWRRIMAGLDRHFGQNAELDPETRDAVEGWLARSAGPDRSRGAEPPLRITTLPWFVDEHDEVPQGAVARPSVRSMANCAACHPGAESWDFDDDRAKIPRG